MTSGTVSSGAKRTAHKNHGSVRGARNSRANSPDYVDEQHHIREGRGFSGWLFVLPAILVALTFVIIPFINTIRLSFTDATFSNPGQFVGLEQYRKMLADDAVHTGLINSSLYVVCVVPCMVILPLILASLVAGNSKVLAFFRASFYLPVVVSTVIVGLVWTNLLDTRGLVNSILESAGWIKQAVPFLTDRWLLLFSAMAITIWTGLGYYMIIYLSALANIDPSLYEAAALDGAGVVRRFLHVTVPGCRSTMVLIMLLSSAAAFRVFNEIYVLTGGTGGVGGRDVTMTMLIKNYGTGLNAKYGYAGAISMLVFLIVGSLIAIEFFVQRKVDRDA
ncbi:carbohydrate ABC transporter permease [Bifidobacterium longum]|jgi:multiple sugar transport system permease protein|uniref:Sugar transport system permease protein n=1 Tax=Bifidobacterium longum subsp. longum TaxID=1679 RepID=A0A4R0UIN9_BIFLL|nr:sugar ABC transporter permease [Bifidobacterium longum]MBL3915287.1 sugar ABC transporter permease [Bifidobacterium longum subsp. suis]TCE71664.1 Sugar transport system permease protein [Bifidobacterium longum subsp. longum]TCF31362.1 Sugar transport system permease protein [Bifidobacterium longum subsp. longum]